MAAPAERLTRVKKAGPRAELATSAEVAEVGFFGDFAVCDVERGGGSPGPSAGDFDGDRVVRDDGEFQLDEAEIWFGGGDGGIEGFERDDSSGGFPVGVSA